VIIAFLVGSITYIAVSNTGGLFGDALVKHKPVEKPE
jgi:hypothetical protein